MISTTDHEKAYNLIRTDLDASLITQWGWRSVQNRLRIAHQLYVDQYTVNAILRDLDPMALQARAPHNPRRRRQYMVKGPNRLWSIDAI